MILRPDPKPPKAVRDKKYLAWILTQPSVLSGRYSSDIEQIVYAHDTGGRMALKDDDTQALPLLATEHLGGQISEHNGYRTFWAIVEQRTGKTRDELCTEHWERYQKEISD